MSGAESAEDSRTTFDPDCRACPRLVGFLDGVKREHPDYHARPVAILRGRILALALLAAYTYSFSFSSTAGLVTVSVLVALAPWLFMRAQLFRFVNTSWRGIRFGFEARVPEAYQQVLPIVLLASPIVVARQARSQRSAGLGPGGCPPPAGAGPGEGSASNPADGCRPSAAAAADTSEPEVAAGRSEPRKRSANRARFQSLVARRLPARSLSSSKRASRPRPVEAAQ